MNEEFSTPAQHRPAASPLIPILLLATSLAAVLIWQIITLSTAGKNIRQASSQIDEAIEKRQPLVTQSGELQNKLQAMVVDLLELANTSEKAKAIVQKYNIQRQAPPAAPAPAAAP